MTGTQQSFQAWAVVELFGRQRVAGRISEQAIGGETFIRVDIPKPDGTEYTRLFGKGAIYCINLCEEATARAYASHITPPLRPYTALPAPTSDPSDDEQPDSWHEPDTSDQDRGRDEEDFDDDDQY